MLLAVRLRGAHCGGNRDNKVKSVEISSIVDGGYVKGMGGGELKDTSYKLSTPSSHQKLKRCRPIIYQVIIQSSWLGKAVYMVLKILLQ